MAWKLRVDWPSKYDGSFPSYHLPKEIGHFSISSEGKFCDDNHQLKYLVMPNETRGLHMDLDEGNSKFIHLREDSEKHYGAILRWIMVHQDEIQKHFMDRFTSRVNIDFICSKGILKKICSTIYKKSDVWGALVGKYKSVIYLVEERSLVEKLLESESKSKDASKGEDESEGESERKDEIESKGRSESVDDEEVKKEKLLDRLNQMSNWGFKFEQYMTSDRMHSKPDTTVPVNENEQFYTVLKAKFGEYTLVLRSELDCVDAAHFDESGHDPISVLRYVELKTTRKIDSQRQHRNFLRYKLLDWYLQSFLVGTPRVICGMRDDAGIVQEIKNYNVRDMPNMAQGMWSPAACLNFGSRVFDFVKGTAVKDSTEAVYFYFHLPDTDDIFCAEMPAPKEGFPFRWYTESDFAIR